MGPGEACNVLSVHWLLLPGWSGVPGPPGSPVQDRVAEAQAVRMRMAKNKTLRKSECQEPSSAEEAASGLCECNRNDYGPCL